LQQAKGYAPIDSSQLFKGPDAYQQIVQSKEVDFILITTPPYFHPHHLETVVAAGKHVYCEKPVAVDVPGAHHVISIGEKAQGKISLAVGFQIRNAPPMVELTRRIHEGALGKVACGLAYYYCAHIDGPNGPAHQLKKCGSGTGCGTGDFPVTSLWNKTSTSLICATGC
jgi:predicted dehydrogenase